MTTQAQKQAETSVGEAMNLRLASPFHLHGVGPAYTWRLAMSGVETVGEIVDHRCLDELAEDSRIPLTVLRKIQRARGGELVMWPDKKDHVAMKKMMINAGWGHSSCHETKKTR